MNFMNFHEITVKNHEFREIGVENHESHEFSRNYGKKPRIP